MMPVRSSLARSITAAVARLRRPLARELPTGLHTCALCGSDFVNPVDWEPVTEAHWWIRLRCGACDTFREVTVENDVAARFELELTRRADVLARAVERLDRQQMAADVERMIAALRNGGVGVADFAT